MGHPREGPKDKVLELLKEGPMDAESVAAGLGSSYSYARTVLADLIRDGFIDVVGKVRNRKQYGIVA